ncbi:MAG: phosphatidate cytidylyltransferase [Treponema sp.]|jgi:dolichol kinase|nr:phosphatidate cytidylyltransferase [Treponema sp.]
MSDLRLPALPYTRDLKTELIRKLIHFLIAFCPVMAGLSRNVTIAFLAAGVLSYTAFEVLRLAGVKVPIVSSITAAASRARDEGHFVLGPVTLALGALFSILAFSPAAAAIAIYALAFGDGLAGLVGRFLGRFRPAFMNGKSIEGSLACFIAVFIAAFRVCGSLQLAGAVAVTATFVEAFPLEDYDNLMLPLSVGFVVQVFL